MAVMVQERDRGRMLFLLSSFFFVVCAFVRLTLNRSQQPDMFITLTKKKREKKEMVPDQGQAFGPPSTPSLVSLFVLCIDHRGPGVVFESLVVVHCSNVIRISTF